MKNSMSLVYKSVAAIGIAFGATAANACTDSNGQPKTCPPTTYNPIPSSPPTTPIVVGGGDADAIAKAKAIAKAEAAALALAAGGTGTGGSVGGINIGGTTYKGSAYSTSVGTTGHGCFRGKGGFSLGVIGLSFTFGGGEEWQVDKLQTLNDEGKLVEVEGNLCGILEVDLAAIAAGATPYATNGQIRLGALTAANASPNVKHGLAKVDKLSALFDRPAPVTNNYFTTIADVSSGKPPVGKDCPPGTKHVLSRDGEKLYKSNGDPVCDYN